MPCRLSLLPAVPNPRHRAVACLPLPMEDTEARSPGPRPRTSEERRRIVVVTSSASWILRSLERWMERLRLRLPAGSTIAVLRGSATHAALLDRSGIHQTLDFRELRSWLGRHQPDLLYYPRLQDLAFGVAPLIWQQARQIALPRVWINACTPPSSVRERLLVREMMMTDGEHVPALNEVLPRPPWTGGGGLTWLVRNPAGINALERLRPRSGVAPRFGILPDFPGDGSPFGPPAALADQLRSADPLGIPPLVGVEFPAHGLESHPSSPALERAGSAGSWRPGLMPVISPAPRNQRTCHRQPVSRLPAAPSLQGAGAATGRIETYPVTP